MNKGVVYPNIQQSPTQLTNLRSDFIEEQKKNQEKKEGGEDRGKKFAVKQKEFLPKAVWIKSSTLSPSSYVSTIFGEIVPVPNTHRPKYCCYPI